VIARDGWAEGGGREIAHGIASAVHAALAARGEMPAEARAAAWRSAVDIAELLELPGLAALLSECATHAGDPPLAVANVLQRLARLARETDARGDLSIFLHADHELASLAGVLAAQEWASPGAPGSPAAETARVAVEALGELLADLELDHPEALARVQVTMPVAAALRAALDWIGADLGGLVHVQVQDAAMQLSARAAHEPGLRPAGAVLASAGGALLAEPDGRWTLRVPVHRERPAFLLARQGALSLALPWHSVARLRIVDEATRMVMTEPSLVPWSPLERPQGERPAALLAWGLTRAWLHLDAIVWRVFARPEPAGTSDAVPGGRLVVRIQDGGTYTVVDVAEALEGVPPLDTPAPHPRPRNAPAKPPGERARAAASEAPGIISGRPGAGIEPGAGEPAPPIIAPGAPPHAEPPRREAPSTASGLRVLGPDDARPRRRPGSAGPADARAWPATPVPPAPPSASATWIPETSDRAATRRALIIEDSLVARIALGRVLEREGWVVEWVERAGEIWDTLAGSRWDVVFVDVSLPDSCGRPHLEALAGERGGPPPPYTLVALTRDAAEERLALASGIERTLRKPFAPGVLDRIVRALPAPRGRA
jgi:CheY-like chemotaxis protein